MLQDIRDKSRGIVVRIIVGFVVVTFALFGIEVLVKSFNSSDKVAEVDGIDITRTQMMRGEHLQRRQIIAMSNGKVDPALVQENVLQRNVLNELIQRVLLSNQAKALDLGVSDSQVDSFLMQTPQFQTNGKFDQTKYTNFIRALGFTLLTFKQQIKENILIQQTESAIVGSDFVLPYQVDAIVQLQSQERSFDYVKFSLSDQAEKISVNDKELKSYYDEHKSKFKLPEQVRVNYVVFSASNFGNKVKVSDAELQDAYKSFLSGLPKEKRKAAHILISTMDRTDKEAEVRLKKVEEKLAAGSKFSDLVKEYSDDMGSKKEDGELGYIAYGTMVKPFDDALFSMKEGQVKGVKTKFGWHLIKLENIKYTKFPSFSDKKADLEKVLLVKKTSDAFMNAREDIIDLAYASDNLGPLAKEYGVRVQRSGYFSRKGDDSTIASNKTFVNASFDDTVLKNNQNSDLIELNNNTVAIVHLGGHKLETVKSFVDAKKEVVSTLVQEKAKIAIKTQAEAAKKMLNTKWTSVRLAKRNQDEIASLAFTMPYPDNGKPVFDIKTLENGDLVFIRLNKVQVGSDKITSGQVRAYKQYLDQIQVNMDEHSQKQWLENKADIQRK